LTIPSVISKVSGATTTETLNQKIILPGSIQSGDMIFVAFAANKNVTVTWDNSAGGAFTSLFSLLKSTTAYGTGYYKIANGTESSATLSIVTSVSVGAAWTAFRIQGHNSAIEATVTGTSTGLTCSPVGLAPSWGSKDVLWISGLCIGATPGVTTAPSSYSATFTIAGTGSRSCLTTVEKGIANTLSESIAQSTWQVGSTAAQVMFLVGIQGAASAALSISSVSTDNRVYSAEADTEVIGTGLSAGVSVTYKDVACTVLSASGSTSIKVTFPNFFSNNIKIGAAHEFKVVG
jgi:hypothetical protein